MRMLSLCALALITISLSSPPALADDDAPERVLIEFDAEHATRVRQALAGLPVRVFDIAERTVAERSRPTPSDATAALPRSDEALDALAAVQALYAAMQAVEPTDPSFLRLDKVSVNERGLDVRLQVSGADVADGVAAGIATHEYFRARSADLARIVHQGALVKMGIDSGLFSLRLQVPFRAVEPLAEGKPPADSSQPLLPHQPLAQALADSSLAIVRVGAERRERNAATGLTTSTRDVTVGSSRVADLIAALHRAQATGYFVTAVRWQRKAAAKPGDAELHQATFEVRAVVATAGTEGTPAARLDREPPHDTASDDRASHDVVALWRATALVFDHLTRLERIELRERSVRIDVLAPDVERVDAVRTALAKQAAVIDRAVDPQRAVEAGRMATQPTGNVKALLTIPMREPAIPEPGERATDPLAGSEVQAALRASKLHVAMLGALRRDRHAEEGYERLSRELVTGEVPDARTALSVLESLRDRGWHITEARWAPGGRLSAKLALYEALPASRR